jgi:hypothetical protein
MFHSLKISSNFEKWKIGTHKVVHLGETMKTNTFTIVENYWVQSTDNKWPSWSYDSWIYNYLSNQCLSPLILWVRISIRASCTTLCDKVCQWLATGRWFSPGIPVSSTNKTDHHDITEISLKVALSTNKQSTDSIAIQVWFCI